MRLSTTKWQWLAFYLYFFSNISFAACPSATYTKTDLNTLISFDNFGDIVSGITKNAFLVSVNAPDNNCPWDLYIENGVTITQTAQYSTQGVALPLSSINIRAFNLCATPNQEYPAASGIRPVPAITGNFAEPFVIAGPYYVVGTAAADGVLIDDNGACNGLVEINDNGNSSANPTTHTFRFDLDVIPGIAAIIQPGMYRLDMNLTLADDATGAALLTLLYSINIDIQPIIQLKMSSSSQVDFDFTEIKNYTGGVTKYNATRLDVNSSVNWELMAVGTSTLNESTTGASPYWDNSVIYGSTGSVNIPLDILELAQSPANPTAGQSGVGRDYSPALTTPPSGDNNIEVAYGAGVSLTPVAPYVLAKTIAGNWGATGAGNMMGPGSYIVINGAWNRSNFTYMITYRLLPGLPVVFSHTKFAQMPSYAKPGIYTMDVKFILAEDQ